MNKGLEFVLYHILLFLQKHLLIGFIQFYCNVIDPRFSMPLHTEWRIGETFGTNLTPHHNNFFVLLFFVFFYAPNILYECHNIYHVDSTTLLTVKLLLLQLKAVAYRLSRQLSLLYIITFEK